MGDVKVVLEVTTYAVNVTVSDWMYPCYNNSTVFSTCNTSTNDPFISAPDPPKMGVIVSIATVLIVLAVLGTMLNGSVITVVAMNKRLRTASGWFVANLAAGDLLETAVFLPFSAYTTMTRRIPFHPALCAALGTLAISNKFISLSCMALIAFHRYMLITKPRATYKAVFTTRNNVLIVLLSWLLSWTAVIPFHVGYGTVDMNPSGICIAGGSFVTTRAILGTLYALPLLTMLYSYTSIYRYVRKSSYNPDNPGNQNQQKKNLLKVAKNLAVLACVFCVLVGPSCIALVFHSTDWPGPITALVWIMYYSNSCINAFLHIVRNQDFKKACRKLLFCCKPQGEENQGGLRQPGLGPFMGIRLKMGTNSGQGVTSQPLTLPPLTSQPLPSQPSTVSIRLVPREPCVLPSVST